MLQRTSGDYGRTVVYLPFIHAGANQYFSGEVAFGAAKSDNKCLGQHLDILAGLYFLDEIVYIFLYI